MKTANHVHDWKRHRLSLDVSSQVKKDLEILAQRGDESQTSVLVRAIRLLKRISDWERKAQNLCIVAKDGTITRLEIL